MGKGCQALLCESRIRGMKQTTYFVTRQIQWPDGKPVVEVSAGGRDYINPDALSPKFTGEFTEQESPLEAVQIAISVCKQWRQAGEKKAKVAIGFTHGFTMPFEPTTFKEVLAVGRKLEKLREQTIEADDSEEYYDQD